MTISGTRHLTLNLSLKVQYQVKGHGSGSCPGKLSVACDHFGTRDDVVLGQYPVPRPLILTLTLKVKCQFRGHGCASCPGTQEASHRLKPFLERVLTYQLSGTQSLDLQFDIEGQMPGQSLSLCQLPREARCHLRPFWYSF